MTRTVQHVNLFVVVVDEVDCNKHDQPTYHVVSMLIKAYPLAVTLEDTEEILYEHIRIHVDNIPIEVVKVLTVCNLPAC